MNHNNSVIKDVTSNNEDKKDIGDIINDIYRVLGIAFHGFSALVILYIAVNYLYGLLIN